MRLYDSLTGELSGEPLLHHAGFLPLRGVPGYDLLFTPDGQKIVTAAGSHGVFITDLSTRRRSGVLMAQRDAKLQKLIEELKNQNDPSIADVEAIFNKAGRYYTAPRKLQLSRDGKRLLAVDQTGGMQVWDMTTRTALTPIVRHDTHTRIPTPTLSPDGLRLASIMREAPDDKSYMQLFQVSPFRTIKKSPPIDAGYDLASKQLIFTPDGSMVVAVSDRGTRMWSAIDGTAQPHSTLSGSMLAYSGDGQHDVRVGNTGIRIRNVSNGREIFAIPQIFVPTAPPVFSPDGLLVAVATFGGLVYICNRAAGGQAGGIVILPHTHEVISVAFAPDARRVLTVCQDHVVRVWDLAGTDAAPQRIPSDGLAAMVTYSPDSRLLAKGFGTVWIYNTHTLEQFLRMDREGLRLLTAEFSGDGQRVLGATCMLGRTMTPPNPGPHLGWIVWDVQTKRRVGPVLRYPTGDAIGARFGATISPDGRRVAWAGNADSVQITEVETGKPTLSTPIPLPGGGAIDGLAFSPDGTRLAVKAKAIQVFDALTGKPISPPMELSGSMGRVIFSPDGRRIAAYSVTRDELPALGLWARTSDIAQSGGTRTGADRGGVACVWDATTGKPLTPLLGLADQPTAIALRPPLGDQLLVASFDGTVRAWNLETGQAAFRELRHPSGIMHANYSPNGRWIGYADLMGTTYLRDSQTGDLLVPPMTHTLPGKGFWVAFRPDDRQVAVATGEDTLLWDLAPEQRPVEVLAQVLDTVTGTASDPTGRDIRRIAPDLFQADPIAVNAWHRNRLAELRANRDELTNAWPHIQQLLAASPHDSQLLLARAEIHIARQNWSAALADVDAADGGKGIDAQAQLLRGRAYFELGETRRALEAFDDAAELSPSLWLARLHRGKAKLALGDWAGGDCDIAKALEAGSIPISDVCALALARLADRRTEAPNYDNICRAVNLKSGGTQDPNLAATIAITFACGPVQSVPPHVAVGLASRAVAFNPSRTDYQFALGLAQFRAGKSTEAITNLLAAEANGDTATRLKARLALALASPEATAKPWLEKARADLAATEAELAKGRSLPGTAWVEVEILRRQAESRFKSK